MQNKFDLTSGWKLLSGILSLIFLVNFIRLIMLFTGLSGYFLSTEVILFSWLGTVFLILFFLPIMVFSGFMAYLFLYNFLKEQLIVNKDGIEHNSFGYKLRSNWTNAQSIKTAGILGQISGVYVIPNTVDNWLKLPIKWLVNINQQGEYFVPLSIFDTNWRDSELGGQIKQYAPHLFEKEKSA